MNKKENQKYTPSWIALLIFSSIAAVCVWETVFITDALVVDLLLDYLGAFWATIAFLLIFGIINTVILALLYYLAKRFDEAFIHNKKASDN